MSLNQLLSLQTVRLALYTLGKLLKIDKDLEANKHEVLAFMTGLSCSSSKKVLFH
ncbi:MAG: hypothetical protein P1V97_36280 [Planctomycetota bacterium]|nr:hypothetical protein [Planctomycetota bacterium]